MIDFHRRRPTSNVDDVSNAGACVPKASVSTPDVCNRIKKNLALKRNTFPLRMYFSAIEDLNFHHCQVRVLMAIMTSKLNDVLSAITNYGFLLKKFAVFSSKKNLSLQRKFV